MDYQVPEIRFKTLEGKPILLWGMHTYPNQVVSYHSVRTILRHGDIECVAGCLITSPKPHLKIAKHPKEIEQLLSKYEEVFGVQWMYYLGDHILNYQVPQISFKNSEGKPILLRWMHTYPDQVVSSHSMSSIFRHEEIEWDYECLITYYKPHLKASKHPKEIK